MRLDLEVAVRLKLVQNAAKYHVEKVNFASELGGMTISADFLFYDR